LDADEDRVIGDDAADGLRYPVANRGAAETARAVINARLVEGFRGEVILREAPGESG
jgi:hypothetical protein